MINGESELNPDVLAENPGTDLLTDLNNTIRGGAPGVLQIKEVTDGDAYLANNSQDDALQTGFTPGESVETFTIRVPIFNPYSSVGIDENFASVGFALGDGTQSNYLKVVAGIGGGEPQLQVFYEENDQEVANITVSGTDDGDFSDAAANASGNAIFNLYLTVDLSDPNNVTAQAAYNYELSPGSGMVLAEPKAIGGPIALQGEVLAAVLGQKTIQDESGNDVPSSAVVTMLATSTGPETPFSANFTDLEITSTEKSVAPVANDDAFTTAPDQPVVINVAELLANDSDANPGDTLEVLSVQNESNGTAVLNDNGTPTDAGDDFVTFTPTGGFEGAASFEYTLSDGTGLTADATVTVNVTDVEVLYRVNAGGSEVAATDGGLDWAANTGAGAQSGAGFANNTGNLSTPSAITLASTGPNAVPGYVPTTLFNSERWDPGAAPEMEFTFEAPTPGTYTVNLFMADGYDGTAAVGDRVFDISIEGTLVQDDLDLVSTLGDQTAGMFSYEVEVTDGELNILWEHVTENPLINAIEIIGPPAGAPLPEISILGANQTVSEDGTSVDISIASDIQLPAGEQVDVTLEIASGTAQAGEDFEFSGGTLDNGVYTVTLPIAGGSSDLTLEIDILDDAIEETNEAFTVTITDVGTNATIGTASQTVTIVDNDQAPPTPGEVVYRVNAGGAEVADPNGGLAWTEDQAATTANGTAQAGTPSPYLDLTAPATDTTFGANLTGQFVNNTTLPDVLFSTERFSATPNPDNMSYDFAVVNGEYTVNLYAAEIWTGAQEAGIRVFDVEIEGQLAHDDVDLTADFGWNNVGVLTFDVTVTDGNLDIDFLQGIQNPKISAIEIVAKADSNLSTVSIGAPTPASVEEDGDTGVTTLIFPVTFDTFPSAYTEVSYEVDINGAVTAGTLALGVFDGEIAVNVPNDDADNGAESVTVTLTGVVEGPAVLGTATASGTVTEDDVAPPTPGEIVAAINAGGPALTDAITGITFEADSQNTYFSTPSNTFTDGANFDVNNGNGNQPALDGSVYETERFGSDFTYTIPVDAGLYDLELHFAEIFQPDDGTDGIGNRVFDVLVEGELVLDDYDILAETNGDFNQTLIETILGVDPTTDDDDANLNIQFVLDPGVDNAKISGIVVRTADTTPYEPPLDDLFGTPVEIADTGDAPSGPVVLAEGSNVMSATQEGDGDGANGIRDRDYFTITIPEGFQLTGVVLNNYQNANGTAPDGFLAFQEGAEVTVDPLTGANVNDLLGAIIYGAEEVGGDLLDTMRGGFNDPQTGTTLDGFEQPLTGTYTFWLNQGAGPSTATLDFIVEALPEDISIAIADAPTVEENGDVDATILAFPLTTSDETFSGDVTITFDQDGQASLTQLVTFTDGAGTLTVSTPSDDVNTGDTAVSVTLTGADDGGTTSLVIDAAASTATGTVTEDDTPFGFAPDEDLDQDGILNADDDDIDGDGTLNGLETFRYDATNAGTALTPGESVRLEFDTEGTPFENGLTGALVRPNELPADGGAEEVNLNNAEVSGGTLNITATAGDHFGTDNAQQNAFVAAYSSENGLSVETRFEIPDFDPNLDGDQAPGNFQASGVVIGVDQNTLVKAVYGRSGAQFELAQDATNANNGNGSGTTTPPGTTTPAGAEEVSIRLEVFKDADGNAMAIAFYTFYDAAGDVIGEPDQAIGTITLVDTPTQGNNLKTLVESGAPLGAGVIQTSTGGGSPSTFDVSYQYLEVIALEVPPVLVSVSDAADIEESGNEGTTGVDFALQLSEAAEISLEITANVSVNGAAPTLETFTVAFDATGAGTLTVPVANDDIDDGDDTVALELVSIATPGFEVDPAADTAAGTVTEDDVVIPPAGDVLFRVNVGGPEVAAIDDGPAWTADQGQVLGDPANSPYLTNNTAANSLYNGNAGSAHPGPILPDASVLANTPLDIFNTERSDPGIQDADNLTYEFPVEAGTTVEVRLFFAELFGGVDLVGERVMDVAVEGTVDPALDDIDQIAIAGPKGAFMRTVQVVVSEDGVLDIEAISELTNQRSALKAIEVVKIADPVDEEPTLDQGIAAQSTDEDALYDFTVPTDAFADDGGAENLTLTATLADDSPLPTWLAFDGAAFSGTPENGDVGVVFVKVTAIDEAGQSVDALFDLTVVNTNDAPVVSLLQNELTSTSGTATSFAISSIAAATDEDEGDVADLTVTPSDEAITVVDGDIVIPAGLPAGTYTIDFGATDNDGLEAGVQTVTLTVTDAPDVTPPVGTFTSTVSVIPNQDIVVEVTYSDDREVDMSTFGTDDVTVTDPFFAEIAASSAVPNGNVVTYIFTAPNVGWTGETVDVNLVAGSVTDLAGNPVGAQMTSITILPAPPVLVSISPDINVVETGDTGDTLINVRLFLDNGRSADLDLVFEYTIDGGDVQTISFDQVEFDAFGRGEVMIPVPNDDLANGTDVVNITLVSVTTDGYDPNGSSRTSNVTEDDTVPTENTAIDTQLADEDAAFSFTVPNGTFADEEGEENLTLTATLADDSALPAWLTFDGTTFSGTPENGDVGVVSVKVTATDAAGQSAEALFDLTVVNTNDAPTVESSTDTATATAGEETVIDLAPFLTFDDVDAGDVVTPVITASDPSITIDGTTVTVPATLAEGSYTLTAGATDVAGAEATTLDITLNVEAAPDTTAPTAVFSAVPTVTDADAPIVVELSVADDVALNEASIGQGDVTLNGPGIADLAASDFSFDDTTGIATYTFAPPAGGWDEGDFTANLGEGAITDAAGNAAPATSVTATVDLPDPIEVFLTDAPAQVEAGDAGNTLLVFPVTLSEAFVGDLDLNISVSVNGALPDLSSVTVSFNGSTEGFITIPVENDEADNGSETVALTIESIATDGFTVADGGGSATGTVTEDDQDLTAPTGVIQTASDVASPFDAAVISVVFGDDVALDEASIDGDEVTVSDGATSLVAALVDFDVLTGTATYSAEAPAGGWAAETLDVTLLAGTVFDVAGNTNAEDTSTVTVIPAPLVVTLVDAGALTISEANEDAFTLTVQLSEAATEETTVIFAVTGDVTAGVDYRTIPTSELVFDVGEDTATILLEIFNDDEFEADEALNLTLVSTTDGVIDPAANTLALTITSEDPETPVTGETFELEAEDFTGLGDSAFFAQGAGDASNNALIRLNSQEESTVSTELPEGVTPGVYTIAVTYFDESDGQSTASITVGGETVGSWIWNNDGPGNAAQGENLRTIEFKNIQIEEGDDFSLTGLRGDGEFVRVDKVAFTRTGDTPTNEAPTGTDIPDLVEVDAGGAFSIPFSYSDPEGELVTVAATLSNGDPLPEWLVLDATGLSGTAPIEEIYRSFEITVTASDPQGLSITDTFTLTLNDVTQPEVLLVPTQPEDPDSILLVTLKFIDDGAIDITTAANADFALLGPDGADLGNPFIRLNVETLELELIFDAPDGGWVTGDYTVSVVDGGVSDLGGNVSLPSTPVVFTIDGIDPAEPGFNLDDDLDEDGIINAADGDIDEDGTANLLDRFAYDAADGDVALSDVGSIDIDLAGLVEGDSPFTAGFTGVMPAFSAGTVELDYATNNGAQIVETANGNRLVVESSPTDTNEGQSAFTFGAKVDGDFTLSGTFDNPYFSGLGAPETPANFEQYGLIVGIDGGNFLKFVTGSPGADFELSGKIGDAAFTGSEVKTTPLTSKTAHAATTLDMDVSVEAGAVIFNGTWTTLDEAGNTLETGVIGPVTLTSGALFDAIQAGDTSVAFGITHTQVGGDNDPFTVSVESLSLTDGNVDTEGPTAIITSEGPADADAPLVVTVTYEDDTGVDAATIDGDELLLTSDDAGDTFGTPAVADLGGGVYTYTYAAPAGGWGGTLFTASLAADSVADTLGNENDAGTPVEFTRQDLDPVDDILANLDGVDENGSYGAGDTGSVILTVMDGVTNVRSSNFGANSFELTNTGDKQVAAVLIDVRDAVYGDSVFDFDGSGGDTVAKLFQVNGEPNGATGAFFEGGDSYFLPGTQPIPNTSGSGVPSSGGFRGLLIKFDGSEGGFETGEVVGFSGDMDPNSIAGLTKGSVDSGALDGWDVGGISGAELIGSKFIVVFDDGTTAEGYLHSDGSLAGSVGEAVEGRSGQGVSVTVNGFDAGDANATYGGTEPVIEVTGEAGATVRVTLTKGFNPVQNDNGGVADIVANRLATQHPDFPVNNAFDVQTVDVVIGPDGTATVPVGAFDYNNDPGNVDIPDAGIQPISVSAAVIIDSTDTSVIDKVALGPVSDPVYLSNPSGTPVVPGEVDPGGYFEGIDTGGGFRFKIQIEDTNAINAGPNPGGDWEFLPDGDSSLGDAQGTGSYYWEFLGDGNLAPNTPQEDSFLTYQIFIPEGEEGQYTLRVRGGRESADPSDARNDIWFRIDDDAEQFLVNETDAVSNNGFIKIFGNPTGQFGFVSGVDSVSEEEPNFQAVFDLEAGFHTITIAGRSPGFNIDFFELNKGGNPGLNAANSDFVPTGPTEPEVVVEIDDLTVVEGNAVSFTIPANAFDDADGDALTLTAPGLPAGFTFENGVISAPANLPLGSYPITILATDDDQNSVSQTFNIVITEQGVQQDFQAITLSAADDIELGSSINSNDLETDKDVQVRLTVQEGVSNVTSVDSAIISWVSERTHSGDATLTFQVEDTKEPGDFQANKDYLPLTVQAQISGTWQDEATIENVVDIADLVNALIESQGPLNSGDVINLQFTGQGATRFIEHISVTLDLSTSGGSSGGGNTPPVVANAIADGNVLIDDAVNIDLSNVFSDADNDALTYSVSGLPNGVGLDGNALTGTPTEVGTFTVAVTANDGQAAATDTFVLTVLPQGDTVPTVANPIADQAIETGEAFSFTVPGNVFDDADGDTLTVSISAPAGFAVNGTTVSAPAGLAAGVYPITVSALDEDGNTISDVFNLTVTEPVDTGDITLWLIDAVTDQRIRPLDSTDVVAFAEVASGQYNIEAEFNGTGDESALFFVNGSFVKQENGVPYAMLADSSGDFNEVDLPASGTVQNITVEIYAQNGGNGPLLATSTFNITFAEGELPNRAPVTDAAVADEDVALGAPVDIDVSNVFSDPDGDGLTLQATGLPQGVTLNGTSISGTPTTPGTFNVTVTASDGEFTASDTFTLTVLPDTSTEPEVNVAIAKQMITDDEAFSFTVPGNAFDDADGDPLSISIAAPAGFSVNGSTVSAPAGLAPGSYTFTVTATDPDQNAVSQSFSLTVNEAPPEPEGPVTLWLVDPDTDQLIRPLSSMDVIGLDELTSGEYNIAAIYDGPGQPKSARMFLDGQQLTVQGGLPYALFNDSNGDYNGEPLGPLGSNAVISAQVFASGGGNGELLGEVSVTVTFVAEGPTESASNAPMLQSLPPAMAPQGFELSEDELQADAGPAQVALGVPVFEMPVELTAGLVMSPVMGVEASSFALTPAMSGLAQLDTFDFSGVPSEPIQSQLEAFMTVPMTDAMSAQAPLVQSGMIEMAVDQFGFDEPFNWSEDDAAWNTPG